MLDEPYLCSFGSAFVNVSREDVAAAIDVAVAAIHAEGALAGIHCCGNTDWSLVLSTAIDVVNFDAYSFFQGIPLYPEPVRAFLNRGGILSWGHRADLGGGRGCRTPRRWSRSWTNTWSSWRPRAWTRERVVRQSMLTPSCGMGS